MYGMSRTKQLGKSERYCKIVHNSAKLELSHLRYDDQGVSQLLIRKPLSFVAQYAHPRYHLVI